MSINAEFIIRRSNSLNLRRQNWLNIVQEVYDFIEPMDGDIYRSHSPGQDRRKHLFDQTSSKAFQNFTAGMYSNITPANDTWFKFGSSFEDINDDQEASLWFDMINSITARELANSNFDMEIQKVYGDLGIPGRAAIICLPGRRTMLNFTAMHYSNTTIDQGFDGRVDTLYREFKWTARQAFQRWGDKVSEKIREFALDPEKQDTMFDFIHAIFPRSDRNIVSREKQDKPFADIYVDKTTKTIIEEGGFEEQPFAAPRFYRANNEIEGRSPGMRALPSSRMIHEMMKTMIQRANWDANPPIMYPDDDILDVQITPSMKFGYRPHQSGAKPEFLAIPSRYELPQWIYEKQQEAINSAFFTDFFALLSNLEQSVDRTAFEVGERLNEKVDLLSVARASIKNELLDPLMTRVVNLLMRNGAFPPIPQSIAERPSFEIEYRGRLSILAKSLEVRNVKGYLNDVIQVSEVFPSILDHIDDTKLNKTLVDAWGANIINKDIDQVLQEREASQEQQALEQEALLAAEAAKAVPGLQKRSEEGSPIDNLVNEGA